MFLRKNYTLITENDYPIFFKNLKKSLQSSKIKIPEIRKIENEKFDAYASKNPFSYSIYLTNNYWKILHEKERIAVAIHETVHLTHGIFMFLPLFPLIFFTIFLLFAIFSKFSYLTSPSLTFLLFRFFIIPIVAYINRNNEGRADDSSIKILRNDSKELKKASVKLKEHKNEKNIPSSIFIFLVYFFFFPFYFHLYDEEREGKIYSFYTACKKWFIKGVKKVLIMCLRMFRRINEWLKNNVHLARWGLLIIAAIPVISIVFGWVTGMINFPEIPISGNTTYINYPTPAYCAIAIKNETEYNEFISEKCKNLHERESLVVSYEEISSFIIIDNSTTTDIRFKIIKESFTSCILEALCLPEISK